MRVVGPDLHSETRGGGEREVVHRRVVADMRVACDVVARGRDVAFARRGERCGVGQVDMAFFGGFPRKPRAEVVREVVVGKALLLPDVERVAADRVLRGQRQFAHRTGFADAVERVDRECRRRIDGARSRSPRVVVAALVGAVDLAGERAAETAAKHDVDRRAADVVLRRCGVEHLDLLHLLDRGRFEQCGELFGRHRRGFSVEDDRHTGGAGERERPVAFAHAGQFGEGFVGVGGDFALYGDLEVVAQAPLLDFHQRAFAPDDHFVHEVRRFGQRNGAGVVARTLHRQRVVAEMLEQQSVGTDAGCDGEPPFEVARHGVDIDRVGRLHDDRYPCDGLLPLVDDVAGDGLTDCRCRRKEA